MKIRNSKRKVQNYHKNKSGFTLIEIILIIIIVSIAIPALLILLGQGAKQGVNAEVQVSAANIAQDLMEEIKSKQWANVMPIPPNPYTALGFDGVESRTQCTGTSAAPFNDVDDYNGYIETCTWGGVSFTTTVTVAYADPVALNTDVGLSDYKRITVTVTNSIIGSVALVTVVTNY
ncbi:MAG: hypothetical protein LLF28_07335 [Nitrospiraceae bacterium]|nr:hypothetical protein [Nitrospiraceae bacterium]